MYKPLKSHFNRKRALFAVLFFCFAAVAVKLFYVQIVMHSDIDRRVWKMVNKEVIELPARGDILDANGKVLTTSVKKYKIFIDAKILKKKDFEFFKNVTSALNIKIAQKNISDFGGKSYVVVADDITEDIALLIKSKKIPGVGFDYKYVRSYPEGRLLSHVLGITDADGKGLEGVERYAESHLSGTGVKRTYSKDARGNIIENTPLENINLKGASVTLTIDRNIQFIVESELEKAFKTSRAKRAVAIVQNPTTGAVLALANFPAFIPGQKVKDIALLRNTAVSDIYEPGSTFKIIALSAALEEGAVKITDKFDCGTNGKMEIYGHTIKDDHPIKGFNTPRKIIEQSSNIGTIKIAQTLTKETFYDYIRKFGFYNISGINLPSEARGILAEPKKWSGLSLPNIAFGQGIAVTPLQVINAYSAIANGGVLMRPYIIKSVENSGGEDIYFTPSVVRRVVSASTASEMRDILKNVVDKGTGRSAKISGYSVAGKTGTAQKADLDTRRYRAKTYISSFCGFVPAENPQIVILIVLDEPQGDYYAAAIASPAFAQMAQKIVKYLGIPQDEHASAQGKKVK
jgi:cell division protein FtsI (penicillin-binding protein 3)